MVANLVSHVVTPDEHRASPTKWRGCGGLWWAVFYMHLFTLLFIATSSITNHCYSGLRPILLLPRHPEPDSPNFEKAMSKANYRELKRQTKQARIFVKPIIYNPRDSANNENVPTDHKDKFATIQALGRTPYFTYGYTPSTETSDKPWQLSNRKRANILVQYAAKCRRENRNEAGWRYEVESKIFVRFDFEVAW